MKVVVDSRLCVGSGNCVLRAPEVFDLSEETGTAVVLTGEASVETEQQVLDAVNECPGRALSLSQE